MAPRASSRLLVASKSTIGPTASQLSPPLVVKRSRCQPFVHQVAQHLVLR